MNSALIGLLTIVWLVAAYHWYGRRIARRLVQPDDTRPTPAVAQCDNVDFKTAHPLVLFGHHFSSIAGAGPIVGPVIAVAFFGWGLSLLWILLAVVLMGAVHDYLSLMVSVRHRGRSIPDIARDVVGERSRMLFQAFVLLTLVLVVAVFIDVATESFLKQPQIVFGSLGLIPLAMGFGQAVYRRGLNLAVGSVVALAVLAGLIWLGDRFPFALHAVSADAFPGAVAVVSLGLDLEVARNLWYLVLAAYGLAASVLPVWLLLQPRDYIAYWILILGMGLGFVGLLVSHPEVSAEFFTEPMTGQGPVWPMLFIIIACGAISGFHSIVASGTTAKQLAKESHGLAVGYGAMLTEGLLAVLALLAVAAGLSGAELRSIVLEGKGGPVVAFGKGFGNFVDPIVGAAAGVYFGVTMINAFVMTTLDTSVRLGRFLTTELLGERVPLLRNRFVASLVVILPAYALVSTGSSNTLWPMFAASNQLVAGLALIVLSAWLVGVRKPVWYTLGPACVMLTTTMGALVYQTWGFLVGYDPTKGPNVLLGVIALVLLALSFVVAFDAVRIIGNGRLRASRPRPASS